LSERSITTQSPGKAPVSGEEAERYRTLVEMQAFTVA